MKGVSIIGYRLIELAILGDLAQVQDKWLPPYVGMDHASVLALLNIVFFFSHFRHKC